MRGGGRYEHGQQDTIISLALFVTNHMEWLRVGICGFASVRYGQLFQSATVCSYCYLGR